MSIKQPEGGGRRPADRAEFHAPRCAVEPSERTISLGAGDRRIERVECLLSPANSAAVLDLYLVADLTGSMDRVLDRVRACAERVTAWLSRTGADAAVGVGAYTDVGEVEPFTKIISPTPNRAEVQRALEAWLAGGGGDAPEAQLVALYHLATAEAIGWRPLARRVVIWFGDAPGHDPVVVAEGSAGEGRAVDEAEVCARLREAGVTVLAVSLDTGLHGGLDGAPYEGQATRIATATGGALLAWRDADQVEDALIAALEVQLQTVRSVRLVPVGDVGRFIEAIGPEEGYGPMRLEAPRRLLFSVRYEGPPDPVPGGRTTTGRLDVVVDGRTVASQQVEVRESPDSARTRFGTSFALEPDHNTLTLGPGDTHYEILTCRVRPPVVIPRIDLYFLADNTGSMADAMRSLRREVRVVAGALEALGVDAAYGVGAYRDSQHRHGAFKPISPIQPDRDVFASATGQWRASGGGDLAEGQLAALYLLAEPPGGEIGWREGSRRVVVWLGDAPGHDPVSVTQCNQRFDVTEAMVIERLSASGIAVIGLGVDTGKGSDLDSRPSPGQATRICQASGGSLHLGIDPERLVDEIVRRVLDRVSTVDEIRLVPEGEAAEFVAAVGPAKGYGPVHLDGARDFRFAVRFEGTLAPALSRQQVLGALTVLADNIPVAHKTLEVTVPSRDEAGEGRVGGVFDPASLRAIIRPGRGATLRIKCRIRPPFQAQRVDLYLLADNTASMSAALESVRSGAEAAIEGLTVLGLDLAVGVGSYADVIDGPRLFEHHLRPSVAPAAVVGALSAWKAEGGGDVPEGQLYALHRLAEPAGQDIGWRPGARRIVVWFGDAPGHDPLRVLTRGGPRAFREPEVTRALRDQGISVLAFSVDGGPPGGLDAAPYAGQATRIAQATGGRIAQGIGASSLIDAIMAEVSEHLMRADDLALTVDGALSELVLSVTPGLVGASQIAPDRDLVFEVQLSGDFNPANPALLDGEVALLAAGVEVARAPVALEVSEGPERRQGAWRGPAPFDQAARREPPPSAFALSPEGLQLSLRPGDQAQESLHARVTLPARTPRVDVFLLVDTSDSMKPALRAVQGALRDLLEAFRMRQPDWGDLAFGVGVYRDFPRSGAAFEPQLAPTTDLGQVLHAVSDWRPRGGDDGAEAQLYALFSLAEAPCGRVGWRPGATRLVLWVGDAPGHDPIPAGAGALDFDLREDHVIDQLVAEEILVHAVSVDSGACPGGLDGDPSSEPSGYATPEQGLPGQGTRIAEATGGTHRAGLDVDQLFAIIAAEVDRKVCRFDQVALVPTGDAARFVRRVQPAQGHGPLTARGDHRLDFVVDLLGVVEQGADDQRFDGAFQLVADGAPVARTALRVTVPALPSEVADEEGPEGEPARALADRTQYSYAIKFLCGDLNPGVRCSTPVLPGRYRTEINILNYGPRAANIQRRLYPLMKGGQEPIRPPAAQPSAPCDSFCLNGGSATTLDCGCILQGMGTPGLIEPPLSIGFIELVCDVELAITAVYTASGPEGGAVSLEVKEIYGRPKPAEGVSGYEAAPTTATGGRGCC